MKNKIGIMLANLREEKKITQKKLAQGILNMSAISRLEKGDLEVDYIILESLYERLGKSADKFEMAIFNDDFQMIQIRDNIADYLAKGNDKIIKGLLKQYQEWADMKNGIHIQYVKMIQALICYMEFSNLNQVVEDLKMAWKITQKNNNDYVSSCLCNQEIRILLLIAYFKLLQNESKFVETNLTKASYYLLMHYSDGEELVKVYPHAMWLLAKAYIQQKKNEEAYNAIHKAKKCLINNGSLMPMEALLEIEEVCLHKLNRASELNENKQNREAIGFLYKIVKSEKPKNEMGLFLLCPTQSEYIILNYLVKELREVNGITQEELCEGICEQETLSRIENGKKNPHKKTIYALLQKLGVNRESYHGFIMAEQFELYEKVREYRRCISKGETEEAFKLLKQIQENLNNANVVNKQFLETEQIFYSENLSSCKKIEELKNLLEYTIPNIMGKGIVYRVPFRAEYVLLNMIALLYKKNGNIDNALEIYKGIEEEYQKSRIPMRYHAVPALTFYLNYSGTLELYNDLGRAEEISNDGLQFVLSNSRADIAGGILVNRSCIYEKKESFEMEKKCLLYGYILLKLYKRGKDMDKIKKVISKKYGSVMEQN